MIEIMNLRECKPTEPYDVYIDRRSPVGNPFPMKSELFRNGVCNEYQVYFDKQMSPEMTDNGLYTVFQRYIIGMYHLHEQHGKLRLFCWCAPERCHGETIKKYIEEL